VHLAGGAERDEDKSRSLVWEASRARVRHGVYISVVGTDRVPIVSGDYNLPGVGSVLYEAAARTKEVELTTFGRTSGKPSRRIIWITGLDGRLYVRSGLGLTPRLAEEPAGQWSCHPAHR